MMELSISRVLAEGLLPAEYYILKMDAVGPGVSKLSCSHYGGAGE
jgi:hypothetical protein